MFIPQKDYNFTFCAFLGLVIGAWLGNFVIGLIVGGGIGLIIYFYSQKQKTQKQLNKKEE